jgi:tRNA threonylcarbamoyladenosine biosynthesis protein TsaE
MHQAAPHRLPQPNADPPIRWESNSAAATEGIGERLGRGCHGGEVIALFGEVGAGKTCLVRGIARGLGLSEHTVASPTFALIHEYQGQVTLVHVDLYRLEPDDAVNRLGLEEYLESPAVTVIEWAEKARALLPKDRLEIDLEHRGGDYRCLSFYPSSKRYQTLVNGSLSTGPA